MWHGVGVTILAANLGAVAESINSMASNAAIAIGVAKGKDPGDSYSIVTKEAMKKPHLADAITRSLDYFEFPNGAGLLLVDWDIKSAPIDIRNRIASMGIDAVLADICPEIGTCGRIYRESTSSGLSQNGHVYPGSGGAHGYIGVTDATDIPRATKVLAQRAWLKGYCWIWVGGAGQMLERGPIDVAVASPERLVFEGKAIIVPPLRQGPREARVVDGGLLDTRAALPDLNPDEARRVDELIAAAKKAAEPEAARVKAAWIEKRVKEFVDKGVNELKAREIVKRQLENRVLTPGNELYFDEHGWVSVADVLQDTAKFEGCTCADPDEPYYHSGNAGKPDNNCAVFHARRGGGYVYSQAHGGIHYDVCHDFDSVVAMIMAGAEAEHVMEVWARLETKKLLSIIQQTQLQNLFCKTIGMTKRDFGPAFKAMKGELIGDDDKEQFDFQLYKDEEVPCNYYLAVNGGERRYITTPELNLQLRFRNWLSDGGHVPPVSQKTTDFDRRINQLRDAVIVLPKPPDIMQANAALLEKFSWYFGHHILINYRRFGQAFLDGKKGEYVRVQPRTVPVQSTVHFKWDKFARWLEKINVASKDIVAFRVFITEKGGRWGEDDGRDWFRCTYWLPCNLFGAEVVARWYNGEPVEGQDNE
jgi:hypothetical protein